MMLNWTNLYLCRYRHLQLPMIILIQLIQNSVFSWLKWRSSNFLIPMRVSKHEWIANLRSFQIKNFISVTLSCEISLSPKRAIDDYKLGSLYGQCNNPLRTSNKKRRSTGNEDLQKLTMTNTIKVSSLESNDSQIYSLSVFLTCILFGLMTL